MPAPSELSSTALRCLDGQLAEALGLAVSCRLLSDRARSDGDALTAVTLHQLSSDLADQAAILAPLVRVERPAATPTASPKVTLRKCPKMSGLPKTLNGRCTGSADHLTGSRPRR